MVSYLTLLSCSCSTEGKCEANSISCYGHTGQFSEVASISDFLRPMLAYLKEGHCASRSSSHMCITKALCVCVTTNQGAVLGP